MDGILRVAAGDSLDRPSLSEGSCSIRLMVTVVEGLELADARRSSLPDLRTTGLSFLDEVTGGFAEGHVWVVVGSPGQGRSAMACQFAWAISQHGLETQLVSRKEPVELMSARVASLVAKVPLNRLWSRGLAENDREKLRLMTPRLESAPLSVLGPSEVSIADTDIPGRRVRTASACNGLVCNCRDCFKRPMTLVPSRP